MSGYNDSTICPNCNSEDAQLYSDRKPFEYTSIICYDCGLTINPVAKYMDLDELNEHRMDFDLDPLDKLPEQGDVW